MKISEEFLTEIGELGIEHRDYQIEAVKEIIAEISEKSILLNYPYGTGKTVIALLTFLALKLQNPETKFIFTSAREAAALRCRQALEMAKKFGFVEKLGYLFDPMGKGLSLRQRNLMYSASSVVFSPITKLMNDRFEIKSKLRADIFENVSLIVIDEATDILARDMSGFRLSRYFEGLFNIRKKGNNIAILAMTGTRDRQRANSILKFLGEKAKSMRRMDLVPYKTEVVIQKIKREDYKNIDQLISNQLKKPIETIQKIFDPKLSRLEIMKLSYSGVIDRLKVKESFPTKVGKYVVKNKEEQEALIKAFLRIFKLSHSRLLLLDSTPGEFLKYVESEENKEIFKEILPAAQEIISYRADLPFFDNPEEKTTRGLVHPKVYTAINIITEHLIRGGKIILFTRYLALANQIFKLLEALHYPNVSYLSGKVPEETRKRIIREFEEGNIDVLVFTPLGGRGLNLELADVVIQLDITSNIDDMYQRRERARGCLEYVLVLEGTSEEGKVKEYLEITSKDS
ncbi:MAG: helicase-related protein [Candidatus Heimdallarchaeaceae archaeon]